MISHRYRCIFIHQRKAAGTSIMRAFGVAPEQAEWHLFNNGTLDEQWKRVRELARDYFVFTVVRNPWDRFVSGWKYLGATRERPLVEVLRRLPGVKKGHDYRHLTRPQMDILTDGNGLFVPDRVLRFENLAEDYARFCHLIGKEDVALPRLNVTVHGSYREYFDGAARELFARHFRRDVEMLGYDFDGRIVGEVPVKGSRVV